MPQNTSIIRELLNAVFSDEDLEIFCFDHFRPVSEKFTSQMSRLAKIQLLIDYCERYAQLDDLLIQIKNINPQQHDRFMRKFQPNTPKGHSLQIALDKTVLQKGSNTLSLMIHNDSSMIYQQVTIQLHLPPGLGARPPQIEFLSLKAHSSKSIPIILHANQTGVFEIDIRVVTFPAPSEGFLQTKLSLEVAMPPIPPISLTEDPFESAPVEVNILDKSHLYKTLTKQFNLQELRTLCFALTVDYDDLGGEGKADKARELILYMERHQRLDKLQGAIRQQRPDLFS